MFLLGTLEIGGSETKFVALARRLHDSGLPVHVAYLRPPEHLLPRLSELPHVHLGQRGKWSPGAYKALLDYVDKNSIGSIVTVNPYPLSYAAVRRIWNGATRVRIIASINTSEFLTRRDRRFMHLYKRLLRRCDRIIFGSRNQMELWISRYNLSADRSSVVYNGVDADHFAPDSIEQDTAEIRGSLGIPADSVVIVCVSQLRPEKAHGLLLNALVEIGARSAATPHLIVVGGGAEYDNISLKINELKLTRYVHMVGPSDDVRPFLKAADVFALASTAVETFSNAALEAASMGLPIVMSDVGGAREMFPDSDQCLIFPKGDGAALVNALLAAFGNANVRDRESESLRADVLSRYTLASMDEHWHDILWNDDRDSRRRSV